MAGSALRVGYGSRVRGWVPRSGLGPAFEVGYRVRGWVPRSRFKGETLVRGVYTESLFVGSAVSFSVVRNVGTVNIDWYSLIGLTSNAFHLPLAQRE